MEYVRRERKAYVDLVRVVNGVAIVGFVEYVEAAVDCVRTA